MVAREMERKKMEVRVRDVVFGHRELDKSLGHRELDKSLGIGFQV